MNSNLKELNEKLLTIMDGINEVNLELIRHYPHLVSRSKRLSESYASLSNVRHEVLKEMERR